MTVLTLPQRRVLQGRTVARVRLVEAGTALRPFCAWVARVRGGWAVAARYATSAIDVFQVTLGVPAGVRARVEVEPNAPGLWSLCPVDWLSDEDTGDWLVTSPGGVPLYRLTGVPDVAPWSVPKGAREASVEPDGILVLAA